MCQTKYCPDCNTLNRKEASFCKICGKRLVTSGVDASDSNGIPEDAIGDFMHDIIGHKDTKDIIYKIISTHRNQLARGIRKIRNNDMLILGNSGTGKTLLVKSIARELAENGILKKSEPIVLNAVTSLQNFLTDAEKNINALDGTLVCIDSFQGLAHIAKNGSSISELERLFELKSMIEESGGYLMVVLTGSDNGDISSYLRNNNHIASNFRHRIDIEDYSIDELVALTKHFLSEIYAMSMDSDAEEKLKRVLKQMVIDKDTQLEQNGKYVIKLVDKIFDKSQQRDSSSKTITSEDISGKEYKKKSFEEAVGELDQYVGIEEIKKEIKTIGDSIKAYAEDGREYVLKSHYLFLGNPGTGKTTVARVLSNVFTALEVLPLGHIVEVDRSQIVSSYVGETAKNVAAIVKKAQGGILFIDEAYTLIKDENDSFGKEAVDTLLKLMEDYRGKFVVIAAGYTNEMRRFVDSNPGLKSRFNKTINFRDYKPEELTQIFYNFCNNDNYNYMVDTEYQPNLLSFFKSVYNGKGKDFANARTVRNIFELSIERHNSRMEALREKGIDVSSMKRLLTKEDIEGDAPGELTVNEAMAQLNELIGMDEVKDTIRKLKVSLSIEHQRIERGLLDPQNSACHFVITGNPGTGKTTIAKLLGSIFHAIGLLPTDKVIEKEAKDLKSSYVNQTAQLMNDAVDEALGGVLFIDEAYMLMDIDPTGEGDRTGKEAIGALITRMLNDAGKFVLIMAGYPKEMKAFIEKANPGFMRRFRSIIHIEDYSAEELHQIFKLKSKKQNFKLTDEADSLLNVKIEQMVNTKTETFGNAGEIDKLFASILEQQSIRLSKMMDNGLYLEDSALLTIEAEDIPIERSKTIDVKSILDKLNGFTGLSGVKRELRNLVNTINVNKKIAELQNRITENNLDHYVFMGNPGTGKTTIARMMADIFFSMGLLPTNNLISVAREDLVAGYVGQTAPKTKQVVQSALGGVLFIDEAYSLVQGPNDSFGMEALNTLLPLLLTYKNKFVCIVAGYTSNMTEFLRNNPGLSSRFTKQINFEDYNPEELTEIFSNKVRKEQFTLSSQASEASLEYFRKIYSERDEHFGNARSAENFFEKVKTAHSNRVANMDFNCTDFDTNILIEINEEDIINAL